MMISKNLGKCFDASRDPLKIALIEPRGFENPRQTTYADFDAECDAVARGLLARGYGRGDRIGILSMNSREVLCAYLGIMRAGMVAVPISFKLAAGTIAHIARDAELAAIFHDADRPLQFPEGAAAISFDADRGYRALLDPGALETVEQAARGGTG